MENGKSPSPWVTFIVGTALTLFWIYLNIRHWKEPDADYMAIAVNIIVTALVWALLLSATWWNVRSAPRRGATVGPQTIRPIDGLDDVPIVDIYSLKFVTSKREAVRKTELVGYLKERGIEVDEDYPGVFLGRMAHLVVPTHDDRIEVPPHLRDALIEKLPKFRLGKLPEHPQMILESKLLEQGEKLNEKDRLLREANDAHRNTHNALERCQDELRIQRIHKDEAQREMAWLKLHELTRERWNVGSMPRQPAVTIQWIGWKESLPIANEIENVFKKLDWHVVKEEARDAGRLRNRTQFRVMMESRTNMLAGQVAGLFNYGKLITQDATPSDPLQNSVPAPVPGPTDLEGPDLTVTVFP